MVSAARGNRPRLDADGVAPGGLCGAELCPRRPRSCRGRASPLPDAAGRLVISRALLLLVLTPVPPLLCLASHCLAVMPEGLPLAEASPGLPLIRTAFIVLACVESVVSGDVQRLFHPEFGSFAVVTFLLPGHQPDGSVCVHLIPSS